MGFFARLFGSSTDGRKQRDDVIKVVPRTQPLSPSASAGSRAVRNAKAKGHSLTPWKDVPVAKSIVLPSERDANVYVYDSSSFNDRKFGEAIELTLFPGQASMKSTATEARWSTREGGVCLLYNERPIGFTRGIDLQQVRKAHNRGIRVKVSARIGTWMDGYDGIKDIQVFIPRDRGYLDKAITASVAGIPESASRIDYNEWDKKDFEALKAKKKWDFPNAMLEFLPVTKGSTAKPVIEVRSKDGVVISRVTGRNGYYSALKEAADTADRIHVTAVFKSGSEYQGYAISIWYWNE